MAWITRFNYFPIFPSSQFLLVRGLCSEDQVCPHFKGCGWWQSVCPPAVNYLTSSSSCQACAWGRGLFFLRCSQTYKTQLSFSKNESSLTLFFLIEMWSLQIKKMVKAGAQLAASSEGHIYIHFNMHELIPALRQSSVFCGQQRWSDDWLINVLFAFFMVIYEALDSPLTARRLFVCFWHFSRMLSCCRISVWG